MKHFSLILIVLAAVFRVVAQPVAPASSAPAAAYSSAPATASFSAPVVRCEISGPAVDEHVELMSIVARLSGYDEYCGEQVPGYLADIRRDLAPHASHPLIAFMKEEARRQGVSYDKWPALVNESLVRAAVIRYMLDRGCPAEEVDAEMTTQLARGFRWMPELVEDLGDYSSHRDVYPTLDAFYPELIRAFERYADDERCRVAAALNPQQS